MVKLWTLKSDARDNMLKSLNKREQAILLLTSAVIIFGFVFRAIIDPVLTKNETINREIKLAQLKLKKYLRLLNQKDYLKSAYAKISGETNIPQENQGASAGALSEIENLAKNSKLRIIDMRPQAQSYIELRTEGDMESYLKFIYNIENPLTLLQVKKFQLNAKPGSTDLVGTFLIAQVALQ